MKWRKLIQWIKIKFINKTDHGWILVILGLVFILFVLRIPPGKRREIKPLIRISTGTVTNEVYLRTWLTSQEISSHSVLNTDKLWVRHFGYNYVRPGDVYKLAVSTTGELVNLKLFRDTVLYQLKKSSYTEVFESIKKDIPLRSEIVGIKGNIKSSLWHSMRKQNLSPELIMTFADIFAWTIDFLTEPREGDEYRLVWIRYTGERDVNLPRIKYDGKILAAQYVGQENGEHTALRFREYYYDSKGNSLRRIFLSAPLNYRRISSNFTLARFHPILRYWRPHLAVDYSAPIGTPVDTVADGVVIYKGWKGGYGNYLEIKHNNVYTTTYGHLSGFARNLHVGKRVRQGQLIGYVGSTGLSTGAHLCFRISQNGKYVNFLKLKSVARENIVRRYRTEFNLFKQERLRQLALLTDTNLCLYSAKRLPPGTKFKKRIK